MEPRQRLSGRFRSACGPLLGVTGAYGVAGARALGLAILVSSCSGASVPQALPPIANHGNSIEHFSFESLDGQALSSASLANRITVIALLTSYDVPSQVEARILDTIVHHHTPRINVAALILEAQENKPLVEAFVRSVGLTYPVAMADTATVAAQAPFRDLGVPSIVVLDREGRTVFRRASFVSEAQIEAVIRAVEQTR